MATQKLLPLIQQEAPGLLQMAVQNIQAPTALGRMSSQMQRNPYETMRDNPGTPMPDMNWTEMQSGGGRFVSPENSSVWDGGTGNFVPAPVEEEPWYKRMTDDPTFFDRLALGFNTMRLNPDQGLAAVLGERIKTAGETRRQNKTAQRVALELKNMGRFQEAALVEANPEIAKDMLAALIKQTDSATDTIKTRQQMAKLLGVAPGTPEYNAIIAGGKPSDISKDDLDKAKSIRGEFVAIPAVKSFSEQSQAFGRIVASAENPSPAGDLALIFNYMKVLDPGSTVREGEFANAQNAGGVDDRVRSLFNQVMVGTRLTESQRADFVSRAQRLYSNAEQGYAKTEKFYKGLAQRAGLKPEDVIPDYRYGGTKPPQMLVKPAEVPQATWDAMTREQKQEFLDAGR